MKKILKNNTIKMILQVYILVLSLFTLFRLMLFVVGDANLTKTSFLTILQSFIMGIRFDVVISSYILLLPTLVLLIFYALKIDDTVVKKIFFYWILLLFSISFLITAADIPYFIQFHDRFNMGAFKWLDNSAMVFSMIVHEPRYYFVIFPLIVLLILFYKKLKNIFKKQYKKENYKTLPNVVVSIVFLALLFIGLRGRLTESPIRIGTAYISENIFLNKLGLNPMFTLLRSYLDDVSARNMPKFMDDDVAVEKVKSYLKIAKTIPASPIAREVVPETIQSNSPNVVLIIMESMAAVKMNYFGSKQNKTPFLDSLATKSLFFTKMYSAGNHTFNGIFSTLYSFPALFREHTMTKIRKYSGLPQTLKSKGYNTIFFATHDGRFDNEEGFLRSNGFDQMISQKHYPSEEIKTTYGVPDDFMFRFSMPILDKLAQKNMPFLATFMTTSDHGPYYIPPYFTPKTQGTLNQSTEYADWSLKQFMKLASETTWYKNTIFVFIADHGLPTTTKYDVPLNYFHIPMLIYAPTLNVPKGKYTDLASQLDVYPTIMGLLQKRYINNTLGIDLLKNKRQFTIVNNDNKIGILDTLDLTILKEVGGDLAIFSYKKHELANKINTKKAKADSMVLYAKATLQVTKNMIINKTISLDTIH